MTVKEVEFLVAVALSDNFGDAELILRAMPYFKKEELAALSILPKQALKAGISLSDLFHNAIEEALQKNH